MAFLNKLRKEYFKIVAFLTFKFGAPEKSIFLIQKAVVITPHEKDLYYLLAGYYRTMRKWNDSIDALEAGATLFPTETSLLWALGTWLLKLRRPAAALIHIKSYLDSWNADNDYKLANVYAVLGWCYILLKQWNDAEICLNKSRELAQWDLDACIGYASLYQYTNRPEKAMSLLGDYVDKNPDLYPPYVWKARYLHYYLRQPRAALNWYQDGLDRIVNSRIRKYCELYFHVDGMFDGLLDDYIDALISCDELELALSVIVKYKRNTIGSEADSKNRFLQYYLKTNQIAQAEKFARSELNSARNAPEILVSLAQLEFGRGKIDEASNMIKDALKIDNELVEALDLLGTIQIQKGSWIDALSIYESLLTRYPFAADFLKASGTCHFMLNQLNDARDYYEICLRYNEHDADAWLGLATVHLEFDDRDLAVASLKMALKYDWLDAVKRQHALQMLEQMKSE